METLAAARDVQAVVGVLEQAQAIMVQIAALANREEA
jgi:hypothetical protein